MKNLYLIITVIAPLCIASASPTLEQPIIPIDTSISENEIVYLTSVSNNVHPLILDHFEKYTRLLAPNGKPIHILGQNGVSEQQLVRARHILEFFLTSDGNLYGFSATSSEGESKKAVANAMADNNATLAYLNSEESLIEIFNSDFLQLEDSLSFQDLYATESPIPGSDDWLNSYVRDASYEEIFHLVHGAGILNTPLLATNWHSTVITAASHAWSGSPAAGVWHPSQEIYDEWFNEENSTHPTNPDPDGSPDGSVPFEYIISCIDVYYGQWGHTGNQGDSFFGEYTPNSRSRLLQQDMNGHNLVEQFLPPHLTYNENIDPTFQGEFTLTFNSQEPYTHKSRYFQIVKLSGSNNSALTGNELDNALTGNLGDNELQGLRGNDWLDGADGNDVAIFSGDLNEYIITETNAIITVQDTVHNRNGIDKLVNIETLRFNDHEILTTNLFPILSWRQTYFTTEQLTNLENASLIWGDYADADMDGWNNLYEYALGTDPTAHLDFPQIGYDITSNGIFQIIFRLYPNHIDITYHIESSRDLQASWQQSTSFIPSGAGYTRQAQGETIPGSDSLPIDNYQLIHEAFPGDTGFLRLNITH